MTELVPTGDLTRLSRRQYEELLVIQELYRQQQEMYSAGTHSTPDRIVSISQPHIRPIVRGKAKAAVEFGAKLAISVVNGLCLSGATRLGQLQRRPNATGFGGGLPRPLWLLS